LTRRFDFRTDTPFGEDPDSHSSTLRRYHQLLWSKPLPGGDPFDLHADKWGAYLYHRSELGEFFLSSDAVIPTFSHKCRRIISQLPEGEFEAFYTLGYTIGGMMIYPSNKVDGMLTINGARGFHPRISDRFDLTLECIRRHYIGEPSPLAETLGRYRDFFAVFGNFPGYVDFFLLQDLVTADRLAVKFCMPFEDFKTPAVPQGIDAYNEYRRLSMDFIAARNRRIDNLGL
jgi:hypothetical protein